MRLTHALQVVALFLLFVGMALRRRISDLEAQLRDAGASSRDHAIAPRSRGRFAWLAERRLLAAGAIHRLPDGRCYLDEENWERWRVTRQTRAVILLASVLALLGLLWAAGVVR